MGSPKPASRIPHSADDRSNLYTEPSCRSFEATVIRIGERDGRSIVVLDRIAFYPTSGGQPFDTGQLGSVAVVDTIDEGDEVIHVLSSPMTAGASVHGEIEWTRRFDHMQQHTGQHVLSAAFDRLFENRTTSFHMGTEVSTIDLAREAAASDIDRAVEEANRVVWEDREVSVRFFLRRRSGALYSARSLCGTEP